MRLLTWHGTIIRLERDTSRLSHGRLVPVRDVAVDFIMALPPGGLAAPLAGPGDMMLLPGPVPGTVYLERGGRFLGVGDAAYPAFTSEAPGARETLLLIPDEQLAALRDLLSHSWVRDDDGEVLTPADMEMAPGPVLKLGALTLRLAPLGVDPAAPDVIVVTLPGGTLVLRRVAGSQDVAVEVPLRPQDPARVPAVADAAAFRAQSPARLTLDAPPELSMPPILGSLADRDVIYRRGWHGGLPLSGRHQLNSVVVRERDKYVLLDRHVDGMILDEDGVSGETGTIGDLAGAAPRPFAREGDRYFLDKRLLDSAPYLRGPHAVFHGGGGVYHWLIGSLVRLSLMAPYLPDDVTLLLPGALSEIREQRAGKWNHLELLEAFGFGDMKRADIAGQICRIEEVYWSDRCEIMQIPASALMAARDRVLARRPNPAGPGKRIYVRRRGTRAIANESVVEGVLEKHNFVPVLMEDLTATQQIDVFRQADFVLAAHGAAMANLIFCAPGTRVLELSPDCEYRPFFNAICGKLGLAHAVLPCPTDDGGFDGRLTVQPNRLGLLLNELAARRAA
jgi:hypothetical protein